MTSLLIFLLLTASQGTRRPVELDLDGLLIHKLQGGPGGSGPLSALNVRLEVQVPQRDAARGIAYDVVLSNKGQADVTVLDPFDGITPLLFDAEGRPIEIDRRIPDTLTHRVTPADQPPARPEKVTLAPGREYRIQLRIDRRLAPADTGNSHAAPLAQGTYALEVRAIVISPGKSPSGQYYSRTFSGQPVRVRLGPIAASSSP